jgi:hypothetical protein
VTFDLDVKASLVWRRLGVPERGGSAELERDFGAAYEEARRALEPRYSHKLWALASVEEGRVTLDNDAAFESGLLAKLADGAHELAAMAATVGSGIDDLVEDYNGRGDVFAMTVADAVGSVAAEELVSRVHAAVAAEAERAGGAVTKRVSPGYGDFGLANQPRLLELSGGVALGITLTENFMMVPRKSVTAVAAVRRK